MEEEVQLNLQQIPLMVKATIEKQTFTQYLLKW